MEADEGRRGGQQLTLLADADETSVGRLTIRIHITQCWIIETILFLEAYNSIAAVSLVALAGVVRAISICGREERVQVK